MSRKPAKELMVGDVVQVKFTGRITELEPHTITLDNHIDIDRTIFAVNMLTVKRRRLVPVVNR